jgi:hypothetical protein
MEIVVMAPTPGRTPTSMPSVTPTKHRPRLIGWNAVAKPSAMFCPKSMRQNPIRSIGMRSP